MNELWYYKSTIKCPDCDWTGPWRIFRGPSNNPDGDVIDEEYDYPQKCPKCGRGKLFSGELDFPFYAHENPGVLFIWAEEGSGVRSQSRGAVCCYPM